jgi:site-specific recombinase XerD
MAQKRCKPNYVRAVLRLADLDQAKSAVLNAMTSPASRRVYDFAIEQFIALYCSEPRLALSRPVVTRYRIQLEQRGLAAATINQRLAAVRRLAHEAADSGLLSPELAAGIQRVRGIKQLGQRSGNWLTREQSSILLGCASGEGVREKRDCAILAVLLGCGLRRSELVGLTVEKIQTRQGHWAILDMSERADTYEPSSLARSESLQSKGRLEHVAPYDLRRTCASLCHTSGGELEQIQFLLGHASVQTTERYLGCKQNLGNPVNDRFTLLS